MNGVAGYADLHIGLPMRRLIITELAEVRGRREERKVLFDVAIDRGQLGRVTYLGAQLDGDREAVRILMRLLHQLRGDR